jgi:hypothetical protein
VAVDPYAFAPEVEPAVAEINRRFPALGRGGTYTNHGEDEPGRLAENFYSADFWSTDRSDHDEAFHWIIRNAIRLNLKYVISWGRIWSVARAAEGIRPYYRDANQDGVISPSERHSNHIHTSFNESGYYMPSLSDIRAVIREELKANNDNAADAVLTRDGKVRNIWGREGAGTHTSIASALEEIGKDTKTP